MRQTILVIGSGVFLFLGCATTPPTKPVVEVGQLDVPALEAIIGASDGSGTVKRVPMLEYDKASCMKPKAAEEMKAYLWLMESYIKRHCPAGQFPPVGAETWGE